MAIDIGKTRRGQPQSALTEQELSKLQGIVGSLQYTITHARPDIASRLSEVQRQLAKPNSRNHAAGKQSLARGART